MELIKIKGLPSIWLMSNKVGLSVIKLKINGTFTELPDPIEPTNSDHLKQAKQDICIPKNIVIYLKHHDE
jgi:hypothetical protein